MMKRGFDILTSALLLILFSPLILAVAILVRLKLGSPVLFRQVRPGFGGQPFRMVKFRSMAHATGPDGRPLSDAERLTSFGKFLRSSSLDELPELWNVLKGDMSLVGPRPLLMEFVPLYSERQARRHEVLPGITGWAQVNGRNSVPWDEKFELDVWYVENQSFLLDLKILWKTFGVVLRADGINDTNGVGQEKFKGSAKQ
jgi:lipopolysaccharide/colanic/teichoic acid biosynthesis glycosyltransferase